MKKRACLTDTTVVIFVALAWNAVGHITGGHHEK